MGCYCAAGEDGSNLILCRKTAFRTRVMYETIHYVCFDFRVPPAFGKRDIYETIKYMCFDFRVPPPPQ